MTSKDLVIRTERNVIDIVLSNESEIKALRSEFEDFKIETRQNFTAVVHQQEILASEIRGLNRTVDTMISISGWGFALVAIAVAIAPMLREFFVYRHDKDIHEEISRQLDAKLSELQKKLS